jgi:RNase H-fold protein (predicted Holliday junction resolvase)
MKNRIRRSTPDRMQEVRELFVSIQQEAYKQGYEDGKVVAAQEAVKRVGLARKSANQQRAELIQHAKEFIDNSIQNYFDFGITTFEFVVNAEKRTVVALERGNRTKTVYKKGIAKCHPNEVFNADIGKAVALSRALQIDIPIEFLEAVQPDEVVVGHKVRGNYAEENYEVPAFHSHEHLDGMYGRAIAIHGIEKSAWVGTEQVTIIDDTNAQYEITP